MNWKIQIYKNEWKLMQVFPTDGKQSIRLSLEKNKDKKFRNGNSNYTTMSNPMKMKEERDRSCETQYKTIIPIFLLNGIIG